jgi:hypothetical protein
MRPYLAVIKDSFREALASRVLWILLLLLTVVLIALAGLSLVVTHTGELTRRDFLDPAGLAKALVESENGPEDSFSRHVWERLSSSLKTELRAAARGDDPMRAMQTQQNLLKELNAQLRSREFYDEQAFDDLVFNDEARALRKKGVNALSEQERLRFHRLALESAFKGQVATSGQGEVRLSYFGMQTRNPLPIRPNEVE